MRGKFQNLDQNLKPKLAVIRQCTSVTDRRTDRWTLTSVHKRQMYILHLALKNLSPRTRPISFNNTQSCTRYQLFVKCEISMWEHKERAACLMGFNNWRRTAVVLVWNMQQRRHGIGNVLALTGSIVGSRCIIDGVHTAAAEIVHVGRPDWSANTRPTTRWPTFDESPRTRRFDGTPTLLSSIATGEFRCAVQPPRGVRILSIFV